MRTGPPYLFWLNLQREKTDTATLLHDAFLFWDHAAQVLPTCSGLTLKGSKLKQQHYCIIMVLVQGLCHPGSPYLF